jgi:uroporphyrinogen-III synthase
MRVAGVLSPTKYDEKGMAFDGLRVLSLESRRAAEIDLLIRKQEGEPFVAPSLKEKALDDHTDALRLLEGLEQGRFELLILMTGVGLAFWRDVITTHGFGDRTTEALRRAKLLARGPKPVAVLRSMGLAPDVTVPEPNTWREILEIVRSRSERRLAILEYGRPNIQLLEALLKIGIHVGTFALYRWELPDDRGPLREAVRRLASREVDVVLFTSSIQVEHLLAVAAQEGVEQKVRQTLTENVAIASIGPIMNASLEEQGIKADIVPSSPKVGLLVKAAADEAADVLAGKRPAKL